MCTVVGCICAVVSTFRKQTNYHKCYTIHNERPIGSTYRTQYIFIYICSHERREHIRIKLNSRPIRIICECLCWVVFHATRHTQSRERIHLFVGFRLFEKPLMVRKLGCLPVIRTHARIIYVTVNKLYLWTHTRTYIHKNTCVGCVLLCKKNDLFRIDKDLVVENIDALIQFTSDPRDVAGIWA